VTEAALIVALGVVATLGGLLVWLVPKSLKLSDIRGQLRVEVTEAKAAVTERDGALEEGEETVAILQGEVAGLEEQLQAAREKALQIARWFDEHASGDLHAVVAGELVDGLQNLSKEAAADGDGGEAGVPGQPTP
jgi:predicted nuclease with TOPRIM domain